MLNKFDGCYLDGSGVGKNVLIFQIKGMVKDMFLIERRKEGARCKVQDARL